MNRSMKRTVAALALGAIAYFPVSAQTAQSSARVADGVKAVWTADSLTLRFALSEGRGMGSGYAVWATPRLATATGDTLLLQPSVFRGKRNMHYVERERHFAAPGLSRQARRLQSSPRSPLARSSREVMLGDTVAYAAVIRRQAAPWLWQRRANLELRLEKDGCCSTEDMPSEQLSQLRYVPPFVPRFAPVEDNTGKAGELQKSNPVLHHISEYRPYTKDRILRKESGALYVHFELDKTVLKHDFRDNAQTLDRIVDITRQIMADSTSSVKIIQIIGLASVEGNVRHNEQLAGGRAAALKRYIQQRVKTPDSLYDAVNGGEAWTELRSQIEDSQFEGRDELLRIIDNTPDVNLRERKLKALNGGKAYAWVREHLLSDQRNSGYLRIFYDYVPDTAAKTINAATELIGQGKYAEALTMLQTVKGDRRALNAMGVALCMTGHRDEGIEYIRRAAQDGNHEAQDNLRQWEEIEKAEAEQ